MDRKEFNRLFTMGLGAGIANLNGANNLLEIFRENSLSGLKGIPKTDTHMHIMDFDNFEYPWLNQYPEINKSFLIKDYEKASRKSNISKSIFIESGAKAGSSIEETKRILTLAKQSQKLKGLVPRGTIANQEKFQFAQSMQREAGMLLEQLVGVVQDGV